MALAMRFFRILAVLWAVTLLTFLLTQLTPGDPARTVLGNSATDAEIARVHAELGLGQPILTRYVGWLGDVLTLDFGNTLKPPVRDVAQVYLQAAPATLQIVLMATLGAVLIGIPLGALAAYREGRLLDRATSTMSFGLIATPPFVMGLLLTMLFVFRTDLARVLLALACIALAFYGAFGKCDWQARRWRLPTRVGALIAVGGVLMAVASLLFLPTFPRYGWAPISEGLGENLRFAFLPTLTLALGALPLYVQMLRTDMVRTLQENFVTVARAKGLPNRRIIASEALRPSLFSVTTVIGLSFGNMIGGTVIVEFLFGIPGIGRVLMDAIITKDYPVVQAGVLIVAVCFLLVNLVVDASYALIDPRVRHGS